MGFAEFLLSSIRLSNLVNRENILVCLSSGRLAGLRFGPAVFNT